MYRIYNAEMPEKLISTAHHIHNTTSSHERLFAGQQSSLTLRLLYVNTLGLQHYSINSLLYLRTVQDKYIALYWCITFFYRLTNIAVIVLLKAIAEAMSENRDFSWVFHHIISSDLKVIASALWYCIKPSKYFYSSWICWHMLLNKLVGKYSILPLPVKVI